MKLSIKYNVKLSKWVVYINRIVIFNLITTKMICKNSSKFLYNYFILLRILRQWG